MSEQKRNLHSRPELRERRRKLRKNMTPAENRLWSVLRGRQICGRKFRRQHSVGPYIIDFYCYAEKLAVEVDGPIHDDPCRHIYDSQRQLFLTEQGITILRFSNQQIRNHLDEVMSMIGDTFQE